MLISVAKADVTTHRVYFYTLTYVGKIKNENSLEHGSMDRFRHLKFFVDFLWTYVNTWIFKRIVAYSL